MARKKGYRSPKQPAKLDICRIDTNRLRQLSFDALDRAGYRTGRTYDMPMKPNKKWTKAHFLLSSFISNLHQSKPESGHIIHRVMKRQGKDPDIAHEVKMQRFYTKEAARDERRIWDMQAKAGCKLRDTEIVARDAEREGKPEVASKIRAQSRRPPTPHKRPAKIR